MCVYFSNLIAPRVFFFFIKDLQQDASSSTSLLPLRNDEEDDEVQGRESKAVKREKGKKNGRSV